MSYSWLVGSGWVALNVLQAVCGIWLGGGKCPTGGVGTGWAVVNVLQVVCGSGWAVVSVLQGVWELAGWL